MKKIVFVIEDLKFGGVEVSLINLLNSIDFDKHDYSVLVVMWGEHYELLDRLKPNSHIKLKIIKSRLLDFLFGIAGKIIGSAKAEMRKNQLIRWIVVKKIESAKADVIIRYHQAAIKSLFAQLKSNAKKVAWYHSSKFNDYYLNESYVGMCDRIIVVNETCKTVMESDAPALSEKFQSIENIISYDDIREKSECEEHIFKDGDFNIVTCGRIDPEKGIDTAIYACKLLKDKIPNLKWYIVGGAADDRLDYGDYIDKLIASEGVENEFILLGAKSNPYPYFKQCDLFLQTSREEAQPLTLSEAQICGAVIVSTNTVGAQNLLKNGETGFIVDFSPDALADKIYDLYKNPEEVQQIHKNVQKIDFQQRNNDILDKFYKLIEG